MTTLADSPPEVYATRRRRFGLVVGALAFVVSFLSLSLAGCERPVDPCTVWDGKLSAGGVRKHGADLCL